MGIAALFGGGDIPVDKMVLLLNRLLHAVIDLHAVFRHNCDLAVLHVGNVTGVLDYRRNIGGNEIAALTVAYEQRCILACCDEAIRAVGADDAQRICTLDAVQHLEHGVEYIAAPSVIVRYQLSDDLGVGLGAEFIALGDQKIAQLYIVFYNAVVYDGYLAVAAELRVSIYIVRLAVGRPAGVTDAESAFDALAALSYIAEYPQTPLCLFDLELMPWRDNGNARRVIASVLKPFQPLQQYGGCLFFSDEANDSAHSIVSFRI